MSLTDKKVSDALLQTGVVSAPDRLTGTAAENKAVFDRLMRNVAQSVINPVIDELVGIEGADNIGTPEGSVRQRLDSASDHIGNRENPHNVTPAQIGAETPMEAQNKANEALSQAKQYAETEIRKHIAQSGAVIADGKGNAENANALNGVPGENYLPEKITDLTGAKSYEYAAPKACVARPSFIGRTVQEGTPEPDSPAPIRGVLNPWIAAYSGGPVEIPAGVEPLMALPDGTADRIVLRDGVWGIERKVINLVLNGSEDWIFYTDANIPGIYYTDTPAAAAAQQANIYCDILNPAESIYSMPDYSICGHLGANGAAVCVNFPSDVVPYDDLAALKSWVSSHNIIVYIKRDISTFEPVPAWNGLGKIDPIAVTTTITKPNPDAPISPDNVATITGTPAVATGYRGMVKQLTGELFDGDSFDGANLVKVSNLLSIPGAGGSWYVTGWSESPEIFAFVTATPANYSSETTYDEKCDRFLTWTGATSENIQPQGSNRYIYIMIKKSRLSDSFDDLTNIEKTTAMADWLDNHSVHLLHKLASSVIARHDMDLSLSPGSWTIETGDENGLLESMDISVLPDPAVYGRRVYPYRHVKEGNVHRLTGIPGARQIVFTATGVCQDGDTWTLNGAPVAVTYNDGQALLPTAVIARDVVEAAVEGDVLRLMLQKPTPQKNLLDNANFRNPVNQRGLATYTGRGYTIDRWLLWRAETFITVRGDCIELSPTGSVGLCALTQRPGSQTTYAGTYTLTAEVEGHVGLDYFDLDTGSRSIHAGVSGKRSVISVTYHIDHDVEKRDNRYSILNPSTTESVKIYCIKLEPGSRFTGWDEPKLGQTLAECQRYQIELGGNEPYAPIGIGQAESGTSLLIFVPTPVTLRKNPAVVLSGSPLIAGVRTTVTEAVFAARSRNGIFIRASCTGLTPGNSYLVSSGENAVTMLLDANLSLFDPIL